MIKTPRDFTFKKLEDDLHYLLASDYTFLRCVDYLDVDQFGTDKKIIVRFDVDEEPKNLIKIIEICKRVNIKASFFFRIHSPTYNIFESHYYLIIKSLITDGHEVGLHSEILDFCHVTGESPSEAMKRDLLIFRQIFGLDAVGISSHGGGTPGINNLDFWQHHTATEFQALYEAYDKCCLDLFRNSLYVSDSEWIHWKTYSNGILSAKRFPRLREVFLNSPKLVYLLLHPETFYEV